MRVLAISLGLITMVTGILIQINNIKSMKLIIPWFALWTLVVCMIFKFK